MAETSKPNPNNSYQITYRDFCDARHLAAYQEETAYRAHIEQRFGQIEKAVDLANKEMERRLSLLNEFRAQSVDEQKQFATREVVDTRMDNLDKRLSASERWQSNMEGRMYVGMILLGLLGVGLRFV